jgi:glutamate racemase
VNPPEDQPTQTPIGIFDSGVGGLSVTRAIQSLLPNVPILYVGDQYHVPYGSKPVTEIKQFSKAITEFLFAKGAKLIVVACNTASAAALHYLRETYPQVPFVGMEPAVKPAAETTRSGVVGVLATPATFQGDLYASVAERFAQHVTVMTDTCPGLVQQIEAGQLESPLTRQILTKALNPMLTAGADTIVMGCTHYPFVIPLIQQIAGPNVRVIDPAPAIARQTERLLITRGWVNREAQPQPARFFTTGDAAEMQGFIRSVLGQNTPVQKIRWDETHLI